VSKRPPDGVEFVSMLRTGIVELCERLTSVVRSRSVTVLLARVGLFGSGALTDLRRTRSRSEARLCLLVFVGVC
jgi:hypothetical protein